MTDNPVAAANDLTMWKRETPPIAATSSRVNGSARWLSINQSAFWAGFMDHSLHPKQAHHERFASASFDSPCSHERFAKPDPDTSRRNINQGIGGNITPIVHTAPAHDPTAHKRPTKRDCLSLGQHVREDDDALPRLESQSLGSRQSLEPCQIRGTCGASR